MKESLQKNLIVGETLSRMYQEHIPVTDISQSMKKAISQDVNTFIASTYLNSFPDRTPIEERLYQLSESLRSLKNSGLSDSRLQSLYVHHLMILLEDMALGGPSQTLENQLSPAI